MVNPKHYRDTWASREPDGPVSNESMLLCALGITR